MAVPPTSSLSTSTSTSTSSPDPLRWKALVVLAVAQLTVVLDASIVNVALPSIQRDLHFADSDVQWIVNAYALAFGGFLLLGGRTADLLGRRRVFMTGLGLFAATSLLGGLAPTAGLLIAARVGQGLGAAIIAPAALSIVTTTFTEGAERNKALGIWGALAGAGGAIGVLLGGVLTQWAGWEWVMFVNVPICVVAAVLTPGFVRESRATSARASTSPVPHWSPAVSACWSTRSWTPSGRAGARPGPSGCWASRPSCCWSSPWSNCASSSTR